MNRQQLARELQRLQEDLETLHQQLRLLEPDEDLPQRESVDGLELSNELSPAEKQVLEALQLLSYTEGKITLSDIAATVYLSEAQTWRYLQRLHAKGYIRRIGQRGGWELE